MTPESLQQPDARHGPVCPLNQFTRRNIPKVKGGKICEERESDICRGCAVGHRYDRPLLVVVRGKVVIFSGDKGLKKTPGPPCNACLLYTSPSPRDGLLSRM